MRVLILGGDGYLGWPTAMYLAAKGHDVAVVDSFHRRLWDNELGADSLLPILSLQDRVALWASLDKPAIRAFIGDITDKSLAAGIKGVETVIPGHSAVTTWQAFVDYGEFMKSWIGSLSAAARAGKTIDQAVADFRPADKFKGYDTARAKANAEVVFKEVGK